MRRLLPILLLTALLAGPAARAQVAVQVDTAALRTSSFKASQLIAPGALLGTGALVHAFGHKAIDVPVRDAVQGWRGDGRTVRIDDYLEYLPLAANVGLGLTGVKAEHVFTDRLIETGVAFGMAVVSGKIL